MISIKNLSKTYQTRKNKSVKALNNINLSFEDQGLIFIVGKSGSGKSTLLNLIGGLDECSSGEIIYDNKSFNEFSPADFDAYRNTFLGFIFQEYNLLRELSVYENLSLSLELQGRKYHQKEIDDILEKVDLHGYGERMPSELSVGEMQRIAIARALIKSPKIILADEPTGALDSKTGKQILTLLKDLSKDKIIFVVTHDYDAACEYGDRIIELSDGNIINDSSPVKPSIEISKNINLRKSKLPFKFIFKMGTLPLKKFRFRLILTIFLLTIAFIFFGLAITIASFNTNRATLISMYEENISYLSISKEERINEDDGIFIKKSNLNNDNYLHFKKEFPNYNFTPVFKTYNSSIEDFLYYRDSNTNANLLFNKIYGIAEINQLFLDEYDLKLLGGRLPSSNEEIIITKLCYQRFEKSEYKKNGSKIEINSYQDILDKKIILNNNKFIIVGIIDTKFNEERYSPIISDLPSDDDTWLLELELQEMLEYSIHNLIFVRKGYYDEIIKSEKMKGTCNLVGQNNLRLILSEDYEMTETSFSQISILKEIPNNIIWADNLPKTTLAANEVLLPISSIRPSDKISSLPPYKDLIKDETNKFVERFVEEHFDEIKDEYKYSKDHYYNYILRNDGNLYHPGRDYQYFENLAINYILEDIYLPLFSNQKLYRNFDFEEKIKVVGFYQYTNFQGLDYQTPLIVSNEIFENFTLQTQGEFAFITSALKHNQASDKKLIDFCFKINNNIHYPIINEVTISLNHIKDFLLPISKVFFYIGLGLAAFSSLLLFNFINISINNKKREIGILRSLGSKRSDVFLIFLTESLCISLISIVFSLIACIWLSNYVNDYLKSEFQILISVLIFGLKEIILIFFIGNATSIISTFIPIYKIARKRPIDIIKE